MFWKSAYEQAEYERLRLFNELERLKRKGDLDVSTGAIPSASSATSTKRKRGSTKQGIARPNTTTHVHTSVEIDHDDIELELEQLHSKVTERQALLRGLLSLHRLSTSSEPNQGDLIKAIQATTLPFTLLLQHDFQATKRSKSRRPMHNVSEVCEVFNKIYRRILRAVSLVKSQTGDDGAEFIPTVAEVIKVFQAFLGRLHKIALDSFARWEHEQKAKRRRVSQDESVSTDGIAVAAEDLPHVKLLLGSMVRMVRMLDVSSEHHCQLMEGYLCAILDHLGSSLSLLVFGNPDDQGERGLLPPNGLLDAAHLDHESSVNTAILEGPYIILVLRKAVEFLLDRLDLMPARCLSMFTMKHNETSAKVHEDNIRQSVERTLQNTLLRGAFGDDDDTFYDSLRRDEDDDEDVDLVSLVDCGRQERGSAEKFVGDLWEQLGWNILCGRLAG